MQIRELIATREAVEGQREELAQSNKIHNEQYRLALEQLEHSQEQFEFEKTKFQEEITQTFQIHKVFEKLSVAKSLNSL